MNDWLSYKNEINIKNELTTHPNSKGIWAERFSSVSFESTEIEYLDILNRLILENNVSHVLETGTHKGISTVALGYALKYNLECGHIDKAKLVTIEKNPLYAKEAKERVQKCELSNIIEIVVKDSLDFLKNVNSKNKYDLVFFDSSRSIRPLEYKIIKKRQLIQHDSILVFHDTCESAIKPAKSDIETQKNYISNIDEIKRQCKMRVSIPFCRGLAILQY